MNNFVGDNKLIMSQRNESREPVKEILANIDAIHKELANELHMIEDAIYGKEPIVEGVNELVDDCLLGTLNRQRNTAEGLLKIAVHIREGLW